ncbi:NAD(P) transhydrogenase subunit alpha, partial [Flavobacteriaceae bacterium]|nr:NAD(P) transhydrogenase subunit alpha [Flavobacteriaceae bacterium]
GSQRPLIDLISSAEIIINGTYQNTDDPIDFVIEDELDSLKDGSLIIDVSCDEGMGFYFAKPTTFKHPVFKVGTIDYYAVDHTPSYFWESASRSISAALIIYLTEVLAGNKNWKNNATINNAINVLDGVVVKEEIFSFQNREEEYPHLTNYT